MDPVTAALGLGGVTLADVLVASEVDHYVAEIVFHAVPLAEDWYKPGIGLDGLLLVADEVGRYVLDIPNVVVAEDEECSCWRSISSGQVSGPRSPGAAPLTVTDMRRVQLEGDAVSLIVKARELK